MFNARAITGVSFLLSTLFFCVAAQCADTSAAAAGSPCKGPVAAQTATQVPVEKYMGHRGAMMDEFRRNHMPGAASGLQGIPTADGGIVIIEGSTLVKYDAMLNLVATANLPSGIKKDCGDCAMGMGAGQNSGPAAEMGRKGGCPMMGKMGSEEPKQGKAPVAAKGKVK